MIDSLPSIKKKIKNIKLIIIGKSSYDNALKHKIEKLDLLSYIDFIGWKKEDELYKYLMVSKLGLSPLHRNKHHDTTYANKLFQYISFGLPVICSNSTAQSELVDSYKCGKVFKEKNNTDFERVVVSIFNNKREYELLRSNCFKAIKKLNNSVVSKKMISSYG